MNTNTTIDSGSDGKINNGTTLKQKATGFFNHPATKWIGGSLLLIGVGALGYSARGMVEKRRQPGDLQLGMNPATEHVTAGTTTHTSM